MSKAVFIPAIKQLAKCLKKLNKPVTICELLEACNISMEVMTSDLCLLKGHIELLMDTGVELGYVKKNNDRYSVDNMVDPTSNALLGDAHPDDLLKLLFTQPPISDDQKRIQMSSDQSSDESE